jgi:hypothetical protein
MSLTGTVPFKLYRPLAMNASGDGVAVTTLTGTFTMDYTAEQFQNLSPGAANRTVTLPTADPEHKGVWYTIRNAGATYKKLSINDVSSLVVALEIGESATVACTGAVWASVSQLPATAKLTAITASSGTAIGVTIPGILAITQNGAETNTLADPAYPGQLMVIYVDTDTSGARVVTAASRINQVGNQVMTFTDSGDCITLRAISILGSPKWQVISNEGVALT